MTLYPALGFRPLVILRMLALLGCASSQVDANRSGLLPTREPARSVSHPPQRIINSPATFSGLLQARDRPSDDQLMKTNNCYLCSVQLSLFVFSPSVRL